MKMRFTVVYFLFLSIILPVQGEKKVNLSGFADMFIIKRYGNGIRYYKDTWKFDEDVKIMLGHLNLYTDIKPNNYNRFLTEIRYTLMPHGEHGKMATIMHLLGKMQVAPGVEISMDSLIELSKYIAPENTIVNNLPIEGYLQWGGISIERAWYELNFNQFVNLRAGLFITPFGVWNVDHGSPVITTARQPYQYTVQKILPKLQVGFMGHGMAFLGDMDLTYALYFSNGRDNIDLKKISELAVGGNLKLNIPLLSGLELGFSGFTGIDRSISEKRFVITVNPFDTSADTQHPDSSFYKEYYGYHNREICLGGDLKFFPVKALMFQGEVNYRYMKNFMKSIDRISKIIGCYGLVSYRFRIGNHISLAPYFLQEYITSRDPMNNPNSNLYDTFKGLTFSAFGLNMKVFTYSTFKLEYSIGKALYGGAWKKYEDTEFMDNNALVFQYNIAF